jgi:transcriptional regulator with XRE-family HTH domain
MTSQALAETAPTIGPYRVEVASLPRRNGKAEAGDHEQETIGQRLARLRRERGLTQVELADKLGVAQPVVSDYERGELRLHGQLIVKLTAILGVSAEEILGTEKHKGNGTPIKNRRLLRRVQEIERLPRRDQQALLRTIDRFLESFRAG